MSAPVTIFPSFSDLKLKSSGGGGFSDGGVVSKSVTLTVNAPVTLQPPPGVNWGGLCLAPYQDVMALGGVSVFNFDTGNNAEIEEYLVLEDGSEVLLNTQAVLFGAHAAVSFAFTNGFVLAPQNKLRYKIKPPSDVTGRILLKYVLLAYDQPSDQV